MRGLATDRIFRKENFSVVQQDLQTAISFALLVPAADALRVLATEDDDVRHLRDLAIDSADVLIPAAARRQQVPQSRVIGLL